MSKIIMSFLIGLIFIGCSSAKQSSITYEKYEPRKEVQIVHVKKTKVLKTNKLPISGFIKGHITSLKHNKGIWIYKIKSIDVSNKKLPMVKFSDTKKLAKKGDLVYAIIKNGKLKELFLIGKGDLKVKKLEKMYKKIEKNKSKTYKRTKKRQILGVPSSEKIDLD